MPGRQVAPKGEDSGIVSPPTVDLGEWKNSLITGQPYTEPDPDYLARRLLERTLSAAIPADVMRQLEGSKLQEVIPNVPGAGTGPIEIDDMYVASSEFQDGAPTYVVLWGRYLELNDRAMYTTGATQLQAQLIRLVELGIWPIRCQIKRTDRKDKGDRYLFWLWPVD